MIRFLQVEFNYIEYDSLDKSELISYFQAGHQEEIVCVLKERSYVGILTLDFLQRSDSVSECIQRDYIVMDETIWQQGRKYFSNNGMEVSVPVLNREHQILCLAWQDVEANRELRMLWELDDCENAFSFHDLKPDLNVVTIHGCNELAWYFAQYLQERNIAVNVEEKYWRDIGGLSGKECKNKICESYEIWAEGVYQKSGDWRQERLRSASVEFECIDEIYEANIKAGIIADAEGGIRYLLEKIRDNTQIVIRGTGTKAQDAYDWLLSNGIDICAFQSGNPRENRKSLLGRPIMRKSEIQKQYKKAVIMECSSKHSTWGFGDVNDYAYEGYRRNERYILLRDYIEVPENNLKHVLAEKNVILAGDIQLCSRVCRWWKTYGTNVKEIGYWDILEENSEEVKNKFHLSVINKGKLTDDTICMLVMPKYISEAYVTEDVLGKDQLYTSALHEKGINDYSDYFSNMDKMILLEPETVKYKQKELRPTGILIGAIPAFCGNILLKQSLDGHPEIVSIGEGSYFNNNLYSICIRLAEYRSKDILSAFMVLHQKESSSDQEVWAIYQRMTEKDVKIQINPDKEKFIRKMKELLKISDHFTSQELFVMFHIAYAAMLDREIPDIGEVIIYWEPHEMDRKLTRKCAYWLESEDVAGFTINTVRNRYIRAGSSINYLTDLNWTAGMASVYGCEYIKKAVYKNWKEYTIRFEDLKIKPAETLARLCDWLGISFHESLMQTIWHGKKAFYNGITGFDVGPAYNLYERYLSIFDRMRICLVAGSYQKQYDYPFVNCLCFSRRELQEMYLMEFRWEKLPNGEAGKDEKSIWNLQHTIRHLLWLERFAEVMEVEIDESYGVLKS